MRNAFEQTYRKPQETLEFKLSQRVEAFSFKQSINLDVDSKWMIGLTNLDERKSVLLIKKEKKV